MKKQVIITALVVVGLYFLIFGLVQHTRDRKGPWQIVFRTDAQGEPSLSISQPFLGVTNAQVVFEGERVKLTNFSHTYVYSEPITNIAFGRVLFQDLTFLPGTVTFDMFGHEVECFPRFLAINRKPLPWQSDSVVRLAEKDKLPPEQRKAPAQ